MSNDKRTKHCYDYPRPAVTVDVVLLAKNRSDVEVLLIRRAREPFKNQWALPGGFVDPNESLEAAAARELREETGIKRARLEQIGAFGDPGRDPRGHTVSIVFGAFLASKPRLLAGDDAGEVGWHSAINPPRLAFDHRKILRVAIDRLLVD